ncbi:MAG: hypothetical protein Q4D16_03615 [Eubacteriales bacterium]|nr:hypothetical protein [Eubacteriales bacterium]
MLNIDNKNLERTRLYECSKKVHKMLDAQKYEDCRKLLCQLMARFPDNAEPQNLYGLLMEAQRDHVTAMKHFRAAWALDPAYVPARVNLEYFGTFDAQGARAFNEDDCPPEGNNSDPEPGFGAQGYSALRIRA